mgnify:CR=1 FL=1
MTRGERNNNWGNLKKGYPFFIGEIQGTDQVFRTFSKPEYGFRAMAKVLINLIDKKKLNTISKLINVYAPSSENNTQSYIDALSSNLNIGPNTKITTSFAELAPLMYYIAIHENGKLPPANKIQEGLKMINLKQVSVHNPVSSKKYIPYLIFAAAVYLEKYSKR